jgi:hypothetical protein
MVPLQESGGQRSVIITTTDPLSKQGNGVPSFVPLTQVTW